MFQRILVLVLAFGFLGAGVIAQKPRALVLGLRTDDKASLAYRKLAPAVKALEISLRRQGLRGIRVRLRIFKTCGAASSALLQGRVDFARMEPATYLFAADRNPGVSLLAMENIRGKGKVEGVIVVPSSSKAKTLGDLEGLRFAFGEEESSIGRYLPQAELLRSGVDGRKLTRFKYLAAPARVFKGILSGQHDAGVLPRSEFQHLNREGKLRILHSFDAATRPWVARPKLEEPLRAKLSRAVLSLKDGRALRVLDLDGFLPTKEAHYAPLRRARTMAHAFGSARAN